MIADTKDMTGDPRFLIYLDGKLYSMSDQEFLTEEEIPKGGTVMVFAKATVVINRSDPPPIDWSKILEATPEPEPIKPYSTRFIRKRCPKPRPVNSKPRCQIRAGQYRLFR